MLMGLFLLIQSLMPIKKSMTRLTLPILFIIIYALRMKYLILMFSLSFSLSVFAIYDEDNRVDFYKIQDPKLKEVSKAMAYQIYFDELKGWTFNRYWQILVSTLNEVCPDERFANHPIMRNDCSGILVGSKKLLIPGNCITEHYCSNDLFYFMFNYHLESSNPLDVMRRKKNFYKCEKVLSRVFDRNTAMSYAVIELDKVVQDITPVKISATETIGTSEELISMGHPAGMPLKIANQAFIADENKDHFIVSSDIAGSSKGAGIFNARTYELEGMLIGGSKNYTNSTDGCRRAPVLPFAETQELAIRVKNIKL